MLDLITESYYSRFTLILQEKTLQGRKLVELGAILKYNSVAGLDLNFTHPDWCHQCCDASISLLPLYLTGESVGGLFGLGLH